MDIAVPSNLERFQADPTAEFRAGWSTDTEITKTINQVRADHDYPIDPHTATAWRAGESTRSARPQLVVATAHPSKFLDDVPPPDHLSDLFKRPERLVTIDNDPSELERLIR